MIEGPPIIAIDASGDPLTVLETLYQCYESQSLYLRSYTASISPHSAGASASDPLALALPDEDSLTLIDCYGEQYNRRYSMKDFTLEDYDEDLEGAIRPFSLKYKNRMSLSNELPVRGSRRQSSDERKRESLGVYGAIMQVNWEE